MANSLYEMCLLGIMVVVFIKTNIQSKVMNTATMIPCRHISRRELPIFRMIYEQYSEVSVLRIYDFPLCQNKTPCKPFSPKRSFRFASLECEHFTHLL